jgi:FtsP/CotA-like multicopper oxidase with cupredoxin domain
MQRVTIAFEADNPGPWPFHCHHLYHQVRGMETLVRYA